MGISLSVFRLGLTCYFILCWPLFLFGWYFFVVYNYLYSLCLFLLCGNNFLSGGLFYVCIIFAFLFNMPMFIVHLWLPRAHFQAPVSGSMVLAGVLLRLVGYGLLRVFLVLFNFGFDFRLVWISLSFVGGFFLVYFACGRPIWGSLTAYSSVVYMIMVIGGVMTLRYWGVCRPFVLIVAHCLCSSGFFFVCLIFLMSALVDGVLWLTRV